MDYIPKSTNRKDLRKYSKILRTLFGTPQVCPFPVLNVLDKICDVFPGSTYIIVEDKKMPKTTMARCIPNDAGGFTIEIKESIYDGAYSKQIGAFLGFICHEICHVFLFYIGFTPIYERSFCNNEIPAYCSVEWQAKALCEYTMIPYEESAVMKPSKIIETYHVSKAFAEHRYKRRE